MKSYVHLGQNILYWRLRILCEVRAEVEEKFDDLHIQSEDFGIFEISTKKYNISRVPRCKLQPTVNMELRYKENLYSVCHVKSGKANCNTLNFSVKNNQELKPWGRANRHKRYELRTFPLIFLTYWLNLEMRMKPNTALSSTLWFKCWRNLKIRTQSCSIYHLEM